MCLKTRTVLIILSGISVIALYFFHLWTNGTWKLYFMSQSEGVKKQIQPDSVGLRDRDKGGGVGSVVHGEDHFDLRNNLDQQDLDETDFGNRKQGHGKYFLVCPNNRYAGLGNQLFMFASCVGIAKTLGYNYILNSTFPMWKYFQIKTPSRIELTNLMTMTEGNWRDENWKKNSTNLPHNLTMDGYFQAWTYFKNVTDDIWKYFTVKPQYLEEARQFLRESVPGIKTRICVHVRRGDFLSESNQKAGRTVADNEYFNKSMTFFRKQFSDAYFIIVTEDADWCRNNIFGDDFIFSNRHFRLGHLIDKFGEAVVDLSIMSLCDHAIITSGTFGWWGGWLSGGTVIYLNDFPRPGSQLDKPPAFIREEYYLPDWIGMSNGR